MSNITEETLNLVKDVKAIFRKDISDLSFIRPIIGQSIFYQKKIKTKKHNKKEFIEFCSLAKGGPKFLDFVKF